MFIECQTCYRAFKIVFLHVRCLQNRNTYIALHYFMMYETFLYAILKKKVFGRRKGGQLIKVGITIVLQMTRAQL